MNQPRGLNPTRGKDEFIFDRGKNEKAYCYLIRALFRILSIGDDL